MSPERADGGPVSAASDVFAFGLVLYELLTGRRALDGATFLHVLRQVRLLDAAALAMSVAEPFRTLLPQMIAHDPAPRLTMRQVAERLQPV
jgi:serine/threonine-protein kinase